MDNYPVIICKTFDFALCKRKENYIDSTMLRNIHCAVFHTLQRAIYVF